MNTLIALRINSSLDVELESKASALGISKSKLIRDAILDYLPRAKVVAKAGKIESAEKKQKNSSIKTSAAVKPKLTAKKSAVKKIEKKAKKTKK